MPFPCSHPTNILYISFFMKFGKKTNFKFFYKKSIFLCVCSSQIFLSVYLHPRGWENVSLNAWTSHRAASSWNQDFKILKSKLTLTLPKVQWVIQWKNRASNINLQLFTLSVLKFAALWATNIESGSVTVFPKKNYFPLACHISQGRLILQCSPLQAKPASEKIKGHRGEEKSS